MDSRIPLLIDTDPGVDDALALLMAFADPRHEVVGLTVTAGNVGLRHTVANALKLRDIAGANEVPVYAGCDRPLLHPAPDAAYVHGEDGFGDVGYEPSSGVVAPHHGAEAIIAMSHAHAGRLLLVALGPLTNLALALRLDPTLPERIARLVVMGGAVTGHGNITPAAEFNIYFDPEAAHIVFDGFPRFDLCDWEAVVAHGLHHRAVEDWLRASGPVAAFYERISRRTRLWSADRRGDFWHSADGLAMAFALAPDAALDVAERPVEVALGGPPSRGMTIVDWGREDGRGDNARILQRYDQARFEAMIRAGLAGRKA